MIVMNRDEQLPDVACGHCGGEIVQAASGRWSKYCRDRCRRAYAAGRPIAA
jgi:hypothetical protein